MDIFQKTENIKLDPGKVNLMVSDDPDDHPKKTANRPYNNVNIPSLIRENIKKDI